MLWPGVHGARAFTQLRLWWMARWSQEPQCLLGQMSFCPAWGQVSKSSLPTSRIQASPDFLSDSALLQTAKGGLSSPHSTHQLGCPVHGSCCSLPRAGICPCGLPLPPSLLPGTQVPTTDFSLCPAHCVGIFLTALVIQESFYQFTFSFQGGLFHM